ncbi:MAG: sulfate adenylyltransferase [Candidatus Staskawiczbacteria bacterium]|nr:sulfate adenylyltransferase [Candidatus Staskawiczbacteria bacterium]
MAKNSAKKIKILTTVGPASMEKSTLERMDVSGVDIFRINLSHTKINDFKQVLKIIRSATKKPICVDSEGAQIRTGTMKGGRILFEKNSIVNLTDSNSIGNTKTIPLYPIGPYKLLKEGDILGLDFNRVIVKVLEVKGKSVKAIVLEGGQVGSNKGVNVNRAIELPPFTKKDLEVFKMAVKEKITHVALSFAQSKEDVEKLRKLFSYPVFVISKIECKSGMQNLKGIATSSDALLIDRGDLSRDVPLQKIGLAQKHILEVAKEMKKPVYVATNLLETMMHSSQPTRAEINDITNTLLSGAEGLVLAAETAIGKYPVESVKVIQGIINEVAHYKEDENYLDSIYDHDLIEPHGGKLVQNFINKKDIKNFVKLPKLRVSDNLLLDVVQISEGLYSPIEGFMDYKQLISVLDNYKLPNNVVWTLPILLQLPKKRINFKEGQKILLQGEVGSDAYGLMEVSEIKKIDLFHISKKWFGTTDKEHPGVNVFINSGDYIIGGKVWLIKKPELFLEHFSLTPRQTREIFRNFGWKKIVGFHTRNVIHRGHEHIQKQALKITGADALFISPVIGPKKKNDFKAKPILVAYEIMIKSGNYDPYPVVVGSFATYSRYSGPREAVFTALCRKNFGCSHFIIGRDHTGVGNFYHPNASHEIFKKVKGLGIELLMFDEVYWCNECGEATTSCTHSEKSRVKISGTKARTCLLEGKEIPNYLMRKEIRDMLILMYKNPKEKLFEDGNS